MPSHYLNNLMKKARGYLAGRKPMSPTRKKMKRAKTKKRTQADQLYQLDMEEKEAARRNRASD